MTHPQSSTLVSSLVSITTGMLVLGVLPLPGPYYVALRLVTTVTLAVAAVVAYDRHMRGVALACALLACVFNPVVPVALPRAMWLVVNTGVVAFLWYQRPRLIAPVCTTG